MASQPNCSARLRSLLYDYQGFKEEIVTTIGWYDLLTSTTLESKKSLRAYLYHHLGAPGLHGALCLRGGYRRRRAHAGVGQQQSALHVAKAARRRAGVL